LIAIVSFFILAGCLIIFSATLGLVRFPSFYTRIHSASQAPSLGMICIMVATMLFFYADGEGFVGRALLVIFFLYFTAALGTHMISKSFYHRYLEDVPLNSTSVVDPVECSKPTKEG
jgi:multicomponent Na+:H+ antiporter subunit G